MFVEQRALSGARAERPSPLAVAGQARELSVGGWGQHRGGSGAARQRQRPRRGQEWRAAPEPRRVRAGVKAGGEVLGEAPHPPLCASCPAHNHLEKRDKGQHGAWDSAGLAGEIRGTALPAVSGLQVRSGLLCAPKRALAIPQHRGAGVRGSCHGLMGRAAMNRSLAQAGRRARCKGRNALRGSRGKEAKEALPSSRCRKG
jgi:hypothetical protein